VAWDLTKSQYSWLLKWGFQLKAGVAHQATRHVNYTCQPRSFANVVYQAGRARGLKATCAVFEEIGVVVFCFYRPDALTRPNLPAYPIVRKMRGETD